MQRRWFVTEISLYMSVCIFKFFINIHDYANLIVCIFSIGRSWLEFLGIKFSRSGLLTLESIQLPGTNSIEHLFEFLFFSFQKLGWDNMPRWFFHFDK